MGIEIIKEIIKKHIHEAPYAVFFNGYFNEDDKTIIYKDKKYKIYICYEHGYFEVYGIDLNLKEQIEIKKYHDKLIKELAANL